MNDGGGPVEEAVAKDPLEDWRQGDYTLDLVDFPRIALGAAGGMDFAFTDVLGAAVVSQTCDIVNCGEGKDAVIVAPLVVANAKLLQEVMSGRSPACAVLEHPPAADVVVDMGRMTTVDKSVVRTWTRTAGLSTDGARARFGFALERKYGRFAFPDEFVAAISKWRNRIVSKHDKDSAAGRAYRSLLYLRAFAEPHWEADAMKVGFVVVFRERLSVADDKEVADELKAQLDAITLPKGYGWASNRLMFGTLGELTARDLDESQNIDLLFLSGT